MAHLKPAPAQGAGRQPASASAPVWQLLSLGLRAACRRPALLAAAWVLHVAFAALATWPAAGVFSASLAHRPQASRGFLDGFSFDLLVDWRAAYGGPLAAYFSAALGLAAAYAAAGVILEAALLPAYLAPFERFDRGRLRRAAAQALPGLAAVGLGSLPLWALLWLVYKQVNAAAQWAAAHTQSEMLPTLLMTATVVAALCAAAVLRVLLNLWKCSRVTAAGGLREALAAARRRPHAVGALAAATLGAMALYAALAGAATLLTLATPHVAPAIGLQQLVVFGAVALRLWLLAACTILWRSADPVLS